MSSPSPSTGPSLKPDGRTRINPQTGAEESKGASEIQRDKDLQSLEIGALVSLYELDLSTIGGSGTPLRFCPTTDKDDNGQDVEVSYGGNTYTYAGVAITDVEWSSSGEQASPKLLVPIQILDPNSDNANIQFIASLIRGFRDLVGAKLTRIRILEKFLDIPTGGAVAQAHRMPDSNAILSRDVFVIEQKEQMTNELIEFVLKPIYDAGRRFIPARQAIKRTCTHSYLGANPTCPYAANPNKHTINGVRRGFKRDGTPTSDVAEDICSRDLKGCKLRFNAHTRDANTGAVTFTENNPLPTLAFPGMSRLSGY